MLQNIFIRRAGWSLANPSAAAVLRLRSPAVATAVRSINSSASSAIPKTSSPFSTSSFFTTTTQLTPKKAITFTSWTPRTQRAHSSTITNASKGFTAAFTDALYFRPITWILSGVVFSLLGASYLIMSARDFIAYSDEESLKNFKPEHPTQIKVEEYINAHPLTIELRSKPEYTESRPTMKINEPYRNASLTSGVLSGPGKIVVPPYVWAEADGKSQVSILYLGTDLCGYPGLVHGGLLATLLDEGLARCSFGALPNNLGVTANLTINYRRPSPAESFVVLRAKTVKAEGRKAWVEGHIETLPKKEGEEPVILVEASALMIEPKQAQFLKQAVRVP